MYNVYKIKDTLHDDNWCTYVFCENDNMLDFYVTRTHEIKKIFEELNIHEYYCVNFRIISVFCSDSHKQAYEYFLQSIVLLNV